MVTVPEATKNIISKSPYLSEAFELGIVNSSSLARLIKSDLENELQKEISDASIIMAINRLQKSFTTTHSKITTDETPELIVRSNIFFITILNRQSLYAKIQTMFENVTKIDKKFFFTFTEGISETTIVASEDLFSLIKSNLKGEVVLAEKTKLSSITIRLSEKTENTPGIFYYYLKVLAWEGISVVDLVSTSNEFNIIVEDSEVEKAFSVLKSHFNQ